MGPLQTAQTTQTVLLEMQLPQQEPVLLHQLVMGKGATPLKHCSTTCCVLSLLIKDIFRTQIITGGEALHHLPRRADVISPEKQISTLLKLQSLQLSLLRPKENLYRALQLQEAVEQPRYFVSKMRVSAFMINSHWIYPAMAEEANA